MGSGKPYTVAVINMKGGVGKTTTSIALTNLFAKEVGETLLLDLDQQASAAVWMKKAVRDGLASNEAQNIDEGVRPSQLARKIDEKSKGYKCMVIDTPPGDVDRCDAALEAVIANGGFVIVPTGSSIEEYPRAIVTVQEVSPHAKTFVLLTRTRANTTAVQQARRELVKAGATVLKSEIPLRESVANAKIRGSSELASLYEQAANEILELVSHG